MEIRQADFISGSLEEMDLLYENLLSSFTYYKDIKPSISFKIRRKWMNREKTIGRIRVKILDLGVETN